MIVESVDHFFCMHFNTYDLTESSLEEMTCLDEGVELGDHCSVTYLCEVDGCNSPPATTPSSSTCYSCELSTDKFCESVDIPGSCDLVNCTAGVSQCYAKFNQESCSVSLGCASPDITGCEDGSSTCSICAAENCTGNLTSEAVCGSDSGCEQRECLTCTHPACDGEKDTIPESCQYQNCSTGVTECYSQIESCQITRGCKPEGFSCEDDLESCSICEDDTCSLNTSGICDKGGECAPPHQCITCSHPLCGDQPASCSLQECGSGVQQCYTKVDGCSVTKGCKTSDVTCETDDTCTVCEGEECDLSDQSLCEPGGGCEEKIVCNSCNLPLSNTSLTDEAEKKCLKIDTCSKDAKGCIVFVKKKDCNVFVGCDEDDKKETDFIKTFTGLLSDLKPILEKLTDEEKDIIENCGGSADPIIGPVPGSGSSTRINLSYSLLLLGLYYLIV